jgi:ubiquitin C-terminal hydrolase
MNSALQCLSNTPPLNEYFVSGKYKDHVNKVNPLGTKGKLAEEFGSLLKVSDTQKKAQSNSSTKRKKKPSFPANVDDKLDRRCPKEL